MDYQLSYIVRKSTFLLVNAAQAFEFSDLEIVFSCEIKRREKEGVAAAHVNR